MRVAIVGGGIAGAAVARTAPAKALVTVFDAFTERSATRVATGLVNPVVLKRRRAVWRAAEALAEADGFYPDAFRGDGPIYEVLRSPDEVNDWNALSDHPTLGPYLGPLEDVPIGVAGIFLGRVNQSFRVHLNPFVAWALSDVERCSQAVQTLEAVPEGGWRVNGDRCFDAVVLCEGYQARWAEHFWGDLGFARTWGQGLRVALDKRPEVMLHRSHFLLPEGDGTYQLGASYGWGISNGSADPPAPTQSQTDELLESARSWISAGIEVREAWTGIRPTMKDRRPRCGWHAQHPGLGLLNGLGSRGTLHAPMLARELWNRFTA